MTVKGQEVEERGGSRGMKEVVNSFAQLAAIIMILITLAVSTAAVSQWFNTEASAVATTPTHTSVESQSLAAIGTR
jgi:hypothetical protein